MISTRSAIDIRAEDPLSPAGRALIDASQAALMEVYRPEECFSFTPEQLAQPEARFLVAWRGDRRIGCVALVNMGDYGEVKRLYVDLRARGCGAGHALMDALERTAGEIGLRVIRLETGDDLRAATALYRRRGYRECRPFGGYPDIASNLFMEKRLG